MNTERGPIRFEIYTDYENRFRWRLWGDEDQVIADSARSFDSFESAREAAHLAKAKAQLAQIHQEKSESDSSRPAGLNTHQKSRPSDR